MKASSDKISKNENNAAATSHSPRQQSADFTEKVAVNRPESLLQMKIQDVADKSAGVQQLREIQQTADKSTLVQRMDKLGAVANGHSGEAIQRKEKDEEEKDILQGKFIQRKPDSSAASGSNKTGLPDQLKSGVESLSGYSMDDVKVHYNSDKPSRLNAHAYAQGTDIHLASGQEKHLPHEAWHVVQQKQGRVKPTMQMNGAKVNDDRGLEKEADKMGERAVQRQRNTDIAPGSLADGFSLVNMVQRYQVEDQTGYLISENQEAILRKDGSKELYLANGGIGAANKVL